LLRCRESLAAESGTDIEQSDTNDIRVVTVEETTEGGLAMISSETEGG